MLYGEKMAVFSQIKNKHLNKMCGLNVEFWMLTDGTCS